MYETLLRVAQFPRNHPKRSFTPQFLTQGGFSRRGYFRSRNSIVTGETASPKKPERLKIQNHTKTVDFLTNVLNL